MYFQYLRKDLGLVHISLLHITKDVICHFYY